MVRPSILWAGLAKACAVFVWAATASLPAIAQPAAQLSAQERGFEAAQWAMLSSAAKAMQQLGARGAAGSPELAALVRRRQDLVALTEDRERKLAESRPGDARQQQEQAIALRGEIDSIKAEIAGIDKDIKAGYPRYSELANPGPLSIPEVQSMLEEDEGLLLIFTGANDSYVWAVTKHETAWHKNSETLDVLTVYVQILREQLDPSAAVASRGGRALNQVQKTPASAPFDRTTAWIIYNDIIQPVEHVLRGVNHLFVVTDGPLAGLPLSVLVTQKPVGRDDDPAALRDTAWLIERYALTTLPSVTSLTPMRRFPSERDNSAARVAFRGFGAPVLGGQTVQLAMAAPQAAALFRGALADVDSVRNLPSLPQTGREVRRLAASLKAGENEVYLGERATETTVKQSDLSHIDVLAFATHGLVSGDLKGLAEPALVLTPPEVATPQDDGLLTASEIANLRLSADWVILSACNTAAGDGRPDADGLSGLARAFIYAGARALLVSHWPVRDDAAARLTTGAVGRIALGDRVRRAEALRRAMLDVMQDKNDPSLAHPSAWAPFVVVGEGGY